MRVKKRVANGDYLANLNYLHEAILLQSECEGEGIGQRTDIWQNTVKCFSQIQRP